MSTITIESLSKHFEQHPVLQDLNLTIPDGSFFTLLGPSGCGKTTLLRCIAGFNEPDCGRILFDQDDMTHVPAHQRNIGMVFQDYALFPDKTVHDNVAYGLRARKVAPDEVRARTAEALALVDLTSFGSRLPAQLSGGQRQRVALARALVIKPRVLLMDEPLSNLDAKLRLSMRDMIRDLQRQARITTVFVTHDQEEALALSDQVAVLRRWEHPILSTPCLKQPMWPTSSGLRTCLKSSSSVPVRSHWRDRLYGSTRRRPGPASATNWCCAPKRWACCRVTSKARRTA